MSTETYAAVRYDVNSKPLSGKHQAAREYAVDGFPVFPCLPGSKIPATPNGYKDATTDLGQIDQWWAENPDYNIAFCPDQVGLAVVDLDGAEGLASWARLRAEHGMPDTYRVRTPRGGEHLYFTGQLEMTSWKTMARRCLGPHIDTRGVGSYVLLPPSRTEHGEYVLEQNGECAPIQPWMREATARRDTIARAAANVELDQPGNVDRARRHLANLVKTDQAPAEGSRNAETYQRACEVLNLGCTPETALSLMREHWNPKLAPPLEDWELRQTVESAGQCAQNEPGAFAGTNSREAFKEYGERQAKEPASAPFLLTEADVFTWPDPAELIAGFLMQGENACIYGEPKVGKTFIALDIAYSLAANLPVFGNLLPKRSGPVVYLSGEGHSGMKRRLKAWRQARGIAHDHALPFYYKPAVPNTLAGMEECTAYIEGIRGQLGCDPVLVVIDTMARSMVRLNENDAGDVGQYLELTEGLRSGLKCSVLTLAHSGKDDTKGIRGSDASRAGFDAIWLAKVNPNRVVKLEAKWLKDADGLGPFCFRFQPVIVAGMQHGVGVVLEPAPLAEFDAKSDASDRKRDRQHVADVLRRYGFQGQAWGTTKSLAEILTGRNPPPESDTQARVEWETECNQWMKRLSTGSTERDGRPLPTYWGLYRVEVASPGAKGNIKKWALPGIPENDL